MKNLPRSEYGMVDQTSRKGEKYVISTSIDRTRYTLYLYENGEYTRIAVAKTPVGFDAIIDPE